MHLHEEGQYLIHPATDDLFMRTGRQVIEGCQLGISVEVWASEMSDMIEHVQSWSHAHAQSIEACYISPRGSQTILYFIPSLGRFDFDLARECVELQMEILHRYNVGMVEIYQIPGNELSRFVPEKKPKVDLWPAARTTSSSGSITARSCKPSHRIITIGS